ncbi:MAG: hypothetical protein IIA49_16800 [Bacteroidetes bacterium]|nr:hypothetical protein [Bacteroidota bacterium]
MFEKIQKISNPLTIIAIFAGIAEVVSTGALINVNVEVQMILVWFVMLFPVFLAILFFLTLNFNPQVLYAPSDFQNEENYLNTLRIKKNQVQVSFSRLNEELENSTDKILEKVIDRIGQEAESQRQSLRNTIANEIEEVKISVEKTEESALDAALSDPPGSDLQTSIIAYLFSQNNPVTLEEISNAMSVNENAVGRSIERLIKREAITKYESENEITYQLTILT